ncbi:MAG: ATP-binding protein, partial [Anaeroplasmataceae bacterium]|nr:ATP-binding protein [Anaeroplasmataceae bacterium]
IKFIILDVNGEYRNAFTNEEADYIEYKDIRLHHSILSNAEYGKLFRASEGIQYPALQACIHKLSKNWKFKDLKQELENWVKEKANHNTFNENQLYGYLRTMQLRIDTILDDTDLCNIIDSDTKNENTLDQINNTSSKVSIINLNISNDSLDIILFLLFNTTYLSKVINKDFKSHAVLVLEEAHRYINNDSDSTRLGNFFIDKLAREGRKFGLGLIISSQVPSMLSYSIVSQCNSVIMHKITNKRDNEYLRGVLRMSSDIFFDQMNSLPKQYAIVCGEAFTNDVVVKVLNANPLPNSSDPIIK